MKKLISICLSLLLLPLFLGAQTTNDIDIKVVLHHDGSATITQNWDVVVVSGTEWYVPISNLGKMTVSNLQVRENGHQFISEGENWKVDRTLAEKTGRCGIHKTKKGVELCWGQGEYGHHNWEATFEVSGLVQSLEDCDAFNFQFVNTGLAASPHRGKVTIMNDTGGEPWTYDNTKVWSFGFEGEINLVDGEIVAEAPWGVTRDGSMTVMVRFEKGLFQPTVSRPIKFSKMQKKAFKGSSYSTGEMGLDLESLFDILVGLLFILYIVYAAISTALGYKYKKSFFGKKKIKGWYRDVPLEGNLPAAYYVLKNGNIFLSSIESSNLVGAYFLKWILEGYLKVIPDDKRVNLDFSKSAPDLDPIERSLYDMARSASGDNLILEKGEFEKWSDKHFGQMTKWPDKAEKSGKAFLSKKGFTVNGSSTSPQTQKALSTVIEFKNFLNDFTLAKERGVVEVGMWKDYLVYAQLYNIADKVSKELGQLFPAEMEQYSKQYGLDYRSMLWTVNYSRTMATATMNKAMSQASSSSSGGFGGSSSFGGGGGFSGGGFGGGSR